MRPAIFLLIPTLAIAGEFTTSLVATYPYTVSAITTDSSGNTYGVGSRELGGDLYAAIISGLIFVNPVAGITTTVLTGGYDVFVAKLDPNGKVLFTDTFAGKGIDLGSAIALDLAGNIYIAGSTTSPDFPLSAALQTEPNPAYGTGFIIKLSNDGTTILYSTYFGGHLCGTLINALATDSQGNLYLTGTTTALDFPHTAGMPFGQVNQPGVQTTGAIMASISAAGDKILYSGAFVGTSLDCTTNFGLCSDEPRETSGAGISVDAAGNAYMAANTNTTNLPTTLGVLAPTGVGAFIAKVIPAGTVSYSTYLCSTETIEGSTTAYLAGQSVTAIVVDAAGNAYLGGLTEDPNFPTTPGSFQPLLNGPTLTVDGFLSKLNPTGSAMIWSTFLGSFSTLDTITYVQSLAVDASGNVWASGGTNASTFPNANGWITGPEFLVGLNASGSKLTYSALYPIGTVAQAIALDASGLIHAAGTNGLLSTIAPTIAPAIEIFAFQNGAGGSTTARISPAEVITIYGPVSVRPSQRTLRSSTAFIRTHSPVCKSLSTALLFLCSTSPRTRSTPSCRWRSPPTPPQPSA